VRRGCYKEYLDILERKKQETGELIMRKFINLHSSPVIIRLIKSNRMQWAGDVHTWGR
jgi:hypothetical protein